MARLWGRAIFCVFLKGHWIKIDADQGPPVAAMSCPFQHLNLEDNR